MTVLKLCENGTTYYYTPTVTYYDKGTWPSDQQNDSGYQYTKTDYNDQTNGGVSTWTPNEAYTTQVCDSNGSCTNSVIYPTATGQQAYTTQICDSNGSCTNSVAYPAPTDQQAYTTQICDANGSCTQSVIQPTPTGAPDCSSGQCTYTGGAQASGLASGHWSGSVWVSGSGYISNGQWVSATTLPTGNVKAVADNSTSGFHALSPLYQRVIIGCVAAFGALFLLGLLLCCCCCWKRKRRQRKEDNEYGVPASGSKSTNLAGAGNYSHLGGGSNAASKAKIGHPMAQQHGPMVTHQHVGNSKLGMGAAAGGAAALGAAGGLGVGALGSVVFGCKNGCTCMKCGQKACSCEDSICKDCGSSKAAGTFAVGASACSSGHLCKKCGLRSDCVCFSSSCACCGALKARAVWEATGQASGQLSSSHYSQASSEGSGSASAGAAMAGGAAAAAGLGGVITQKQKCEDKDKECQCSTCGKVFKDCSCPSEKARCSACGYLKAEADGCVGGCWCKDCHKKDPQCECLKSKCKVCHRKKEDGQWKQKTNC